MVLITQATSEGSGKPAHLRSLARAFAVRTRGLEVDEGSNQKSGIYLHWIFAHARMKNEFTKEEKYHNLKQWLILTWLNTNKSKAEWCTCSVAFNSPAQNLILSKLLLSVRS